MPLRSTASTSTAAASARSTGWLPLRRFTVICLAMTSILHAEWLSDAGVEFQLHPALIACIVLSVAVLFNWAIVSLNFMILASHQAAEGEFKMLLRSTVAATATALTGGRTFIMLCLGVGALLYVQPLVDAAAAFHSHPCIVACFVLTATALFNLVLLSINFHVARRAAERERMVPPCPAASADSAARSPLVARLAFLAVAALVSASWFVEPIAGAAVFWVPNSVIVVFVLLFAALFNLSVHLFRSMFLASCPIRRPPSP